MATTAYSHQQFCVGERDSLKLKLMTHQDLPHLMLTIAASSEADFTLSGPSDQIRAIVRAIAALIEAPAPASDQQRVVIVDALKAPSKDLP